MLWIRKKRQDIIDFSSQRGTVRTQLHIRSHLNFLRMDAEFITPGQDMVLRSLRHGVHYHLLQCSEMEEVCSMTAKLLCASPSYLTMHVLIYIHVPVLLIHNVLRIGGKWSFCAVLVIWRFESFQGAAVLGSILSSPGWSLTNVWAIFTFLLSAFPFLE